MPICASENCKNDADRRRTPFIKPLCRFCLHLYRAKRLLLYSTTTDRTDPPFNVAPAFNNSIALVVIGFRRETNRNKPDYRRPIVRPQAQHSSEIPINLSSTGDSAVTIPGDYTRRIAATTSEESEYTIEHFRSSTDTHAIPNPLSPPHLFDDEYNMDPLNPSGPIPDSARLPNRDVVDQATVIASNEGNIVKENITTRKTLPITDARGESCTNAKGTNHTVSTSGWRAGMLFNPLLSSTPNMAVKNNYYGNNVCKSIGKVKERVA